jgi:hypothetical protein
VKGIGGNILAEIQVCTGTTKNAIGEIVQTWETVQSLKGWLDYSGGDAKYATYSANVQESTHVFIADYVPLDARISAENCRFLIAGKTYDVTMIDNPMELQTGSQWEISLKYTGGQ